MEGRANSSRQRKMREEISRMQRDLSKSFVNGNTAIGPSNDTMIRRMLPGGRLPHVCVVGAGMAGLRCAEILGQKGVTVTILEARNRIGGRVCLSYVHPSIEKADGAQVHQSSELGRLVDLWGLFCS